MISLRSYIGIKIPGGGNMEKLFSLVLCFLISGVFAPAGFSQEIDLGESLSLRGRESVLNIKFEALEDKFCYVYIEQSVAGKRISSETVIFSAVEGELRYEKGEHILLFYIEENKIVALLDDDR